MFRIGNDVADYIPLVVGVVIAAATAFSIAAAPPASGPPFWEFPEATVIELLEVDEGIEIALEQNSQFAVVLCPLTPRKLARLCQRLEVGDRVFARGRFPFLDADDNVHLVLAVLTSLPLRRTE